MNTHTAEPGTRQGCEGCGHSHPADRGARAGCGKPECSCESSCDLECLERPLFTACMVLSDSDLTALVDWTRTRLGLQRYRDGWGVVCGLDVRCDPDHPGWVVVEPGYAVGCCGEDVVLCEPRRVDLTGCCAVDTPCPDPGATDPKNPGNGEGGEEKEEIPDKDRPPDPCGDVVVDLVLTPRDSPAVTELVVSGCDCGCGGRCGDERIVPTRLREGALVDPVPVPFHAADPVSAAAQRAEEAYSRCHAIVRRYVEAGEKGDAGRHDVVAWLRMQDLEPPCDWWTTTCAALEAADGADQVDAAVAAALFDLVVDCRQRLLRRVCSPCATERVGLGRVWLRRVEDERHGATCVVTGVDAYPPYRRDLAPTARPVPPDADDLAPFIWQRWEQVCHRWRALAPDSSPARETPPLTTVDLLRLFEETDRLWWPCGERPPHPVVVTTACLGDRVVGFRRHPDNLFVSGAASAASDVAAPASAGELGLEGVRGVGPRSAERLRDAGISTIAELGKRQPPEIKAILGVNDETAKAIHEDALRRGGEHQ